MGEIGEEIFAVEEKEVLECLGREQGIAEEVIQLFDALCGVLVDIENGLIVESDRICTSFAY